MTGNVQNFQILCATLINWVCMMTSAAALQKFNTI